MYKKSSGYGVLRESPSSSTDGKDRPLHPDSGVEGHFYHPHDRAWVNIQDKATPILAEIVGSVPTSHFPLPPR